MQGGTMGQIDACNGKYHVTFEQFAKAHVIDPDGAGPLEPQPVWKWLLSQTNPGPAPSIQPSWNFNKYLIARDGTLIAHWPETEYWGMDPNAPDFTSSPVVQAIMTEIAKPKPNP